MNPNNPVLALLAAPPTESQTCGVYVTSQGVFYLIRVGLASVEAARIVFAAAAAPIVAKYVSDYIMRSVRAGTPAGNTDQIKHEAYVLSQATGYKAFETIGTHDSVLGSPLYYGWHFNWDSTEAICVTQSSVVDGITHQYWIARKYKLTVAEAFVDGVIVLTGSVVKESEDQWQPLVQRINLWVPGYDGNMSYVDVPGCDSGQLAPGYGEASWDVPLYGFYTYDGAEEIIYYEHLWDAGSTLEELEERAREATCHCYGHEVLGSGTVNASYEGFTGSARVRLYTSSGLEYAGVYSVGGIYKQVVVHAPAPDYETPDLQELNDLAVNVYVRNQYDFTDHEAWQRSRYKVRYTSVTAEYSSSIGGTAANIVVANHGLIIPFHSSETAYIGLLTTRSYNLYVASETFYKGAQAEFQQYLDGVASSPWVKVYFPVYGSCGSNVESACDTRLKACYNSAYYTSDPVNDIVTPPAPTWSVDFGIVTPWESQDLESIETDDSYSLDHYLNFLNPPACGNESIVLNRVQNYQSALGNSFRTEGLKRADGAITYPFGSNNDLTVDMTEPYGAWLGRS